MVTLAGNAPSGEPAATFRQAMRHLAAAVCVVTGCEAGRRLGMTATAVTSLSMEPPALLVCVNRRAAFAAALGMGRTFCVSILRADQREVATTFSGALLRGEERFTVGEWADGPDGVPHLHGAEATIFCKVDQLVDYATHMIVVGRVLQARVADQVMPLVYADGTYLSLRAQGAAGGTRVTCRP